MPKQKWLGMDERGFSVPALVSTIILILVFVFLFPVIQMALDQAIINFAGFAQSTLLTTMLTATVVVMGLLVLVHAFQEQQVEQQRRVGY